MWRLKVDLRGKDEEAGHAQTEHCPPSFKDLPCQLLQLYLSSKQFCQKEKCNITWGEFFLPLSKHLSPNCCCLPIQNNLTIDPNIQDNHLLVLDILILIIFIIIINIIINIITMRGLSASKISARI